MNVFFKKEFLDVFLSKPDYSSVADQFIDMMLREYSDISVISEGVNNPKNYAVSFLRLRYKLDGGSRTFGLSQKLEDDIAIIKEKELVFYFTDHLVNKNLRDKKNVLILTLMDYQDKLQKLKEELSFGFIIDNNKDWDKLKMFNSNLVQKYINDVTILDPYIFADFYKLKKEEQVSRPFLSILNKIVPEDERMNLEIYTIVEEFNYQARRNISYGNEVKNIIDILDDVLHPATKLSIIDNGKSNKNSKYNFHDRNIISNLFILKVGIGFIENFSDYTNSELECLSVFDKWGYDLIRHRNRMISSYKQKIRPAVFSR